MLSSLISLMFLNYLYVVYQKIATDTRVYQVNACGVVPATPFRSILTLFKHYTPDLPSGINSLYWYTIALPDKFGADPMAYGGFK